MTEANDDMALQGGPSGHDGHNGHVGMNGETGAAGASPEVDRMFSFEDDDSMARLKEIKVKLPVGHHIKLHGLKITQNKPISDVVKRALDDYFAKLETAPGT